MPYYSTEVGAVYADDLWATVSYLLCSKSTQLYERWRVYNSWPSMILQSMIPWMLIVI